MFNILKLEAPSLHSVMSNKFLKITVESEGEHRNLSHILEAQGAEFKTFMLKTDRPILVVLRGLPSCTPIEEIKEELKKEGFAVVSTTQLSKFQSKSPMPLFYAQIANGPLSETVYTSLKCLARKFQWSDTEEGRGLLNAGGVRASSTALKHVNYLSNVEEGYLSGVKEDITDSRSVLANQLSYGVQSSRFGE
ncbi:hypothetical protein HNY73_015636 [Argiope bruennichi]|uniref:Pre-C2HC domain-containing protein n=1 Tax=Argiope bruennichi TaxID=94029 RepID=A0A8T0ESN7_ARGBR|nr:hypothetical protein HNY73_015636 [Argiope bruennichi]